MAYARWRKRIAEPERSAALMRVALQIEHERAIGLAGILPSFAVRPHLATLEMVVAYLDLERDDSPGFPPGGAPDDHPVRSVDGPLLYAFTDRLTEEELTFFKSKLSCDHRFPIEAILNLCDGDHSVERIADLISLDLGRLLAIEDISRGVEILRTVGYVS